MSTEKQCEAILIVSMPVGNPQAGDQCRAHATAERAGHPVCWLHHGAVRGMQFVSRLERCKGAQQ